MKKFLFLPFTPTPNEHRVLRYGYLVLALVWGFIFYPHTKRAPRFALWLFSARSGVGVYLLSFIFTGSAYAQRGLEFLGITDKSTPGELFEKLFFFGLGLVGLAALIVLVFGGMMYLTASDSADQTKRARGYISNAIFGLVLAFLSWLILFTINPDIVQILNLNLKDITLKPDIKFKTMSKQEFVNSPSESQFEKDQKEILSKKPDDGLPVIEVGANNSNVKQFQQALLEEFNKSCVSAGGDFMTTATVQSPGGKATFECKKCASGRGSTGSPSVLNNSQFVGFSCK